MTPAELLADTEALLDVLADRLDDVPSRDHAEEILARYDEADAKLVAAGFPPTSPWWRATIERWYRSGRRQLTGRVGRRGGKSSSLSRLGVVEALYGQHDVPPGDVGTVAIISTDRSEALGRLRTIEAILDALGVAWKKLQAPLIGIELVGRARVFRIFTASIAGVSGFTAIFVLCDEVAKWKDNDAGVNPATEVLASVRPTMATQPHARIVLSSSPMGRLDAHYDAFERGDNAQQITAHAPTWIANPTITEEQTIADEPDAETRAREYGAIPMQQEESALFTEALVNGCMRTHGGHVAFEPGHFYVATIDPATRGNAWTASVTTRGADDVRRVVYTREWRGSPSAPLSPKAVFRELASDIACYGIKLVYTDQWAIDSLRDNAIDAGLSLLDEPWTGPTKSEAYEGLLKTAQSGLLEIPGALDVKNDLLGIRKKLTRNGFVYELASVHGRHSDYAPTIAMGVLKASVRPNPRTPDRSPAEKQEADKLAFLESLAAQRRRAERSGPLPPTHRRFR